jgi:hypothetical protein
MNREFSQGVNRETFIKGGLTAVATILGTSLLSGCLPKKDYSHIYPAQNRPSNIRNNYEVTKAEPIGAEAIPLEDVLQAPLNTPERTALEEELLTNVSKEAEIDQAFWIVTNRNLRAQLLRKRAEINKDDPLPRSHIEWALGQGIHPEVLRICEQAYPIAEGLISQMLPDLRPDRDLLPDDLPASMLMLSEGGLAKLICTESGLLLPFGDQGPRVWHGYSNIGSEPALDQINHNIFPTGSEALGLLCEVTSQDTGLKFKPENIPGSSPKGYDASGGAVSGIQMMPDNYWEMYQFVKDKTGYKINFMDPISSTTAAWIFLARRWHLRGDRIRHGFYRGDSYQITRTLAKWNQYQPQINAIEQADKEFVESFN